MGRGIWCFLSTYLMMWHTVHNYKVSSWSTINNITGNITRTKLWLELYFPDSLSTFPSLHTMTNGIISQCTDLQIWLVAMFLLCKWAKGRFSALAWDPCQPLEDEGQHNWSSTPLFDLGKLCRRKWQYTFWRHGCNMVVHDFPKEIKCLCKQWIPGPSFLGESGLGTRLT